MCTSVTMTVAENAMAPTSIGNPNTTVVISNGGSVPMVFHCQSYKVDLGVHTMLPGGSWSFEFKPSDSGNTIYACLFSWRLEFHYFRIYKQSRDQEPAGPFACKRCEWKVSPEGPCQLMKKTGTFSHCPPWDSQSFGNN
ncbi:hypothetical protein CARUB_v10014884mg [Capsella rubella]|uniref:S-protein homolog n=2 Tax=Capsella rubella TaxID=81985 RepID=R0I1B3_9BRAS|nr:hypothetical protein CARUB_v10014884mg [Capsella rubella]